MTQSATALQTSGEVLEENYYKELADHQAALRAAARPITAEEISAAIKPSAINTNDFIGLFGKAELESGAQEVVQLMQKGDTWREFSPEEGKLSPSDLLNLFNYGWLVHVQDDRIGARFEHRFKGKLAVTKGFVDKCSQKAH